MLIRLLVALFLVAHGAVHAIMFALPYSAQARADLPFNPSHSWLLGETRPFALGLAIVVTLAFVFAALLLVLKVHWWPLLAILASALSIGLLGLYFTKWWMAGYFISAVIMIAAWRSWATS